MGAKSSKPMDKLVDKPTDILTEEGIKIAETIKEPVQLPEQFSIPILLSKIVEGGEQMKNYVMIHYSEILKILQNPEKEVNKEINKYFKNPLNLLSTLSGMTPSFGKSSRARVRSSRARVRSSRARVRSSSRAKLRRS